MLTRSAPASRPAPARLDAHPAGLRAHATGPNATGHAAVDQSVAPTSIWPTASEPRMSRLGIDEPTSSEPAAVSRMPKAEPEIDPKIDPKPAPNRDGPGAYWDRADALRWAVACGLACTGLVTALDWLWVELPEQPWLLRWTRMAADHPWRTGLAGGALCLAVWPRRQWVRAPDASNSGASRSDTSTSSASNSGAASLGASRMGSGTGAQVQPGNLRNNDDINQIWING
jgi:hypothetical protein